MAPVLNVKGQTVKMSFLDLFAPSRPSRRGTGTPRLERKKVSKTLIKYLTLPVHPLYLCAVSILDLDAFPDSRAAKN